MLRDWLALLVLALSCAVPSAAGAADDLAIELAGAPAQSVDSATTIGIPGLVTEIRLRNTAGGADGADGDRTFLPGPTLLRTTDRLARPASWKRLDGGTGDVVRPGTELILQLSADLPEPGTYETWIDTAKPGSKPGAKPGSNGVPQPDRRIHVTITRSVAPVPSDFIQAPKPMGQAHWPWQNKNRTMLIELANATTQPIEFGAPVLLDYATRAGDASDAAAAARMPVLEPNGCASPLAPGMRCAMRLQVGGGLWPGVYTVDVGVGGAGGGWSQKTATVSVRLPLLAAVLATAVGVGFGWLVQAWRASGRRAFDGLIDLGLLRRRVASIADASPGIDLAAGTQPILDAIATLEARCRTGIDASADIAALSDRVGRLSVLASVERAYQPLPNDAKAVLAAPHTRFAGQAATAVAGPAPDGFDTDTAALVQMINDWPALSAVRTQAWTQVNLFGRLLALPTGDPARAAAATARDRLQAALTAALAPAAADAGPGAVADRVVPLQAAVAQAATDLRASASAYAAVLRQIQTDRLAGQLSDAERAAATAARDSLDRLLLMADPAGQVAALEQLWPRPAPAAQGGGLEAMAVNLAAPVPQADLDLPVANAFGLTPDRSLGSLMRQRRVLEWVTNLIILVGISLSGAVLVGNNPAWGTPLDLIGLVLTGLGSRVVIGTLASSTQPTAAAH